MDKIEGIMTCTFCGASATAARKIKHRFDCQLFESKSDRLLNGEERVAIWEKYNAEHPNPELIIDSDFGYVQRLLKAQRALTVSIWRQILRDTIIEKTEAYKVANQHLQDLIIEAHKQEEARVERIIRFITDRRDGCKINDEEVSCRLCLSELLQALKKQEGLWKNKNQKSAPYVGNPVLMGGNIKNVLREKIINRLRNLPMVDISETAADPKPLVIDGSLFATQIIADVKQFLPELAKEAGYVELAKDQTTPQCLYDSLIFPTTIEEAGKFLTEKGLTDREKSAISGTIARLGWENCQIANDEAGWRKVEVNND